jgi:hypothetical protein
MPPPVDLSNLLRSDESDILERKASLSDADAIRNTIIAFANDIPQRSGGTLIIGQGPDKTVTGLKESADEASRRIADIARTQCFPAIPVVIDIKEHEGKRIAVVEVPASIARPHFRGECYVRQGSTNRRATDAEIMALRMSSVDPKLRQLLMWKAAGKTDAVTCDTLPRSLVSNWEGQIGDITETYVSVTRNGGTRSIPLSEMHLGYDYYKDRPKLTFKGDIG